MTNLCKKADSGSLTEEDANRAVLACNKEGGDLFTGGGINMAQSMTIEQIKAQIDILDAMDTQAKDAGAVCASPVYTDFEVKQLEAMGQYAISPNPIEPSEERNALLAKMQITLKQSICM